MQIKGMTDLQISVMHKLSELVPQQHAAMPVHIWQCCCLASTTQNCTAHFVSASKIQGLLAGKWTGDKWQKREADQNENKLTVKTERICDPSPSAAPSHPVNCTSPNTVPLVTAAAAARR